MLNPLANELTAFLMMLVCGVISGTFFDISQFISFLCKENKVVSNVFDFFATVGCGLTYFLTQYQQNYGQVRFFLIVAFVVALILERLTIGKILAKSLKWCYDKYIKFVKKLSLKNKQRKNNDKNTT